MIKFYRTGVLGAINTNEHFVTREVLIHIPVRNWLGIMNQQEPERRAEVWAEIEVDANKERAVSNNLEINRRTIGGRNLALIAGVKLNGTSPASGKLQGAFKYIIVDDEFLVETLRQEFGVKIKAGTKWEDVRQAGQVERR